MKDSLVQNGLSSGAKTRKDKKVAILIPCYNENKTISKVVKDFKKVLPRAKVYVYDNNSTDGSGRLAKKAGAEVRTELRQGKGNVVRSMFREIEADCYVLVDGDDTYPAEAAKEMCRLVLEGGGDMVVGDRLSSNYFKENQRRFHGFGNRLVRWLINLLFRSELQDIMSGYRAFSREFVKSFPILSEGFEIETEMTIHALDKKMKVVEMPVKYRRRKAGSRSKLNTLRDGTKVLITITRLFEEYRPMWFFGFISLIFLALALIFGIPVVIEYFETRVVARFPTLVCCGIALMIAALSFICGVILDVIAKKHKQLFEMMRLK